MKYQYKIEDNKKIKWNIIIDLDYDEEYIIYTETKDRKFLREIEYFRKKYKKQVGYVGFYKKDKVACINLFLKNGIDLTNQGIGTKIVEILEKISLEKDIYFLYGWVAKHMEKSIRFWNGKVKFSYEEIQNHKNKNLKYAIFKQVKNNISNCEKNKAMKKIFERLNKV